MQDDSPHVLFIGNLIFFAGMFTVAVTLGIVCDDISNFVSDVRHGNYQMVEDGHTVILNVNRLLGPVLHQVMIPLRFDAAVDEEGTVDQSRLKQPPRSVGISLDRSSFWLIWTKRNSKIWSPKKQKASISRSPHVEDAHMMPWISRELQLARHSV